LPWLEQIRRRLAHLFVVLARAAEAARRIQLAAKLISVWAQPQLVSSGTRGCRRRVR
jgi:hypothetical protein